MTVKLDNDAFADLLDSVAIGDLEYLVDVVKSVVENTVGDAKLLKYPSYGEGACSVGGRYFLGSFYYFFGHSIRYKLTFGTFQDYLPFT